jgi:simple sugar transport system permease protein
MAPILEKVTNNGTDTIGNLNSFESSNNKKIGRFLLNWAAVLALILSIAAFSLIKGTTFFSSDNLTNILRSMSITTILAIAATITMAPDGFDMSTCTLATFSGYIFMGAYLWYGFSLGMSIISCILFTLAAYLLTMFLIIVCKIPDMLATCALMFVHQGLGQWFTGGGAVSAGMRLPNGLAPARTGYSAFFKAIGTSPVIIYIMLGCVAFAFIFLEFTKHGRYLYAMGGNKTAAKLSGINVKKYRFMAGMITAVFIAIGAIVVCSRNNAAQIGGCDNYLMPSLAAVFVGMSVGGVNKPNALGTLVGAILISVLENGLTMCSVPYFILPFVKGLVLALALVAAYATKKATD